LSFYQGVIIIVVINVIAVIGNFLLTGMTGLLSFGQASFMALGAYISGLLAVKFNIPFPLAILVAIIASVFVGFIIALPVVKLRRDYFALTTFAFGEFLKAVLNLSVTITGGATGLAGIPYKVNIWIVLISLIIVILLVRNFRNSKFGKECLAIRDDELAARSCGIDSSRKKMTVFLFSVAITSFAGCLYGFYTCYIDPSMFGWTKSSELVIMVFFGGLNSLTGVIIGTTFLTLSLEILRFTGAWRMFIYVLIMIILIDFRPQGVFGNWELGGRTFEKFLHIPLSIIKKGK